MLNPNSNSAISRPPKLVLRRSGVALAAGLLALVFAPACQTPQRQAPPPIPVAQSSRYPAYQPLPPGWLPPRPAPLPPRRIVRPAAPIASAARATQIGRSVEGTPINMYTFGSGRRMVFVFGGIHGDEENSSVMAERLIDHLRSNIQAAAGCTIAVVPRANPDGLRRNTRGNVNGVDLNRNFPASNFKRSDRHGGSPLSEPESRAIAQVVSTLKPDLIISLHSIARGAKCNNYDGPAQAVAALMGRLNNYAVKSDIGYPTPGSFGSWCGKDLNIPTITLEIPKSLPGNAGWQQNREAILAAIRHGS